MRLPSLVLLIACTVPAPIAAQRAIPVAARASAPPPPLVASLRRAPVAAHMGVAPRAMPPDVARVDGRPRRAPYLLGGMLIGAAIGAKLAIDDARGSSNDFAYYDVPLVAIAGAALGTFAGAWIHSVVHER